MQILVITRDAPGVNWDGKERLLREEALHVWGLQRRTIVRAIWFTDPDRDAVILMECDSVARAESILDQFPLVRDRMIEYSVMALTAYDGYERLFER
jgi:muconolactone delta-isomerase